MFLAKKLISAWVISPAILGVLSLVGLWLCSRGRRRIGYLALATSTFATILFSLPVVSCSLLRAVELPPVSVDQLHDIDAIVILGGGIHRGAYEYGQHDTLSAATLVRVRYGAWLAKRTELPVLVSGGSVFGNTAEAELMAATLRNEFGVAARWVETQSKDTRENADKAAAMLRSERVNRVAVVTHAFHARRASCLFRNTGLVAVMAPTSETALPITSIEAWLPSGGSVQDSFTALHEMAGDILCH